MTLIPDHTGHNLQKMSSKSEENCYVCGKDLWTHRQETKFVQEGLSNFGGTNIFTSQKLTECVRYLGGSEESEEECGEGAEEGASGEQMSGSVLSSAAQSSQQCQPNAQQDDDPNKMRQMVNISNSPLLQQAELSNSQYDFFKMLDDKINNGPDYQPNCEFEITLEESRLCRLLDEWQMAKQKATWGFQVRQQTAGQHPVRKQLQRYHSLQSNGDIRHKQHFYPVQLQQYPPQQYSAPQQYPPQQYPQPPQYTQQYPHYPQQFPPVGQAGQYPPFLQLSNSVVLFDRSRGGYYTELA